MTPFYLFLCFTIIRVYGRVAVPDVLIQADLNKIHDYDKNNLINIKIQPNSKEAISATTNHVPTKKICHSDVDNNIDSDNEPCADSFKIDNGTALILTPLIEQGRVAEARNACRVDRQWFLGLDSYSGYLTVNSTYNSNLFFWYFPSFAKPINETPWIIWLQGGPGVTSLTGLFDEIGPLTFRNGYLRFNPHTWLMNHSLVFIDNPVGTGFSFTDHKDGYARDMATYSKHLYTAVQQLVQIFPELRVAPLYVAGESYAGKYVPALGRQIHRHRHTPGTDINFKGLILGNAYMEPMILTGLAKAFYNVGLLEREQLALVQPVVDAIQADITANRSVPAKEKWTQLVFILLNMSNQTHTYNYLSDSLSIGFYPFLSRPEVKRAIHVGDIKFSFINITVNTEIAPDFLSDAKPLMEELLDYYRVLVYCGHLDMMVPCTGTSELIRQWRWSGSDKFLESWRWPFKHNNILRGYYKSGGNLTWIVFRGAGHMVPLDQPASSQRVIAQWTYKESITNTPSHLLSEHLDNLRSTINKITMKNETSDNSIIDTKNDTSDNGIIHTRNKTSDKSIIDTKNETRAKSIIDTKNNTSANSITDTRKKTSDNSIIDTKN